jgi:Helicase associated domain
MSPSAARQQCQGRHGRVHRATLKDSTPVERKARLDALGFVWDVLAEQWEVGFQYLAASAREHGHCRVLATHLTADGFPLGQWVKIQRRRKDKISTERKARLDALGFVWDTRANKRRVSPLAAE